MVNWRCLPTVCQQTKKSVADFGRSENTGNVYLLPVIRTAIGAVCRPIIRVDVGWTGEFRGGRVGEAVRIGPVSEHAEIIRQTVLGGQEQRVVAGSGSGVEVSDRAVSGPRCWIQNREQAARGSVRSTGAGTRSGGR